MKIFFIRIRQIIYKEIIQVVRDPRMRILLIGPPVLQLIIFGYAANLDLKNISTGILDMDKSAISRDLAAAFSSSGHFDIKMRLNSHKEMTKAIDKGQVRAVFHFAPGLAAKVKSGKAAEIQIIVSGTDSNTAAKVVSYAMLILEDYNRKLMAGRFRLNPALARILPEGPKGILNPQLRSWYNQDVSTKKFYVPGIIALVIMLVVLILTSMSVVREKEIGTMEQIMVSPIRPVEFILGKTIPFGAIGLIQASLVTTVGVFWFKVPMRGSLALLALALIVYLLSALGSGLLISTVSRTQQQAMITTFFIFFPALLLSGFIFPTANMPPVIQAITYINPVRYGMSIFRGIFLKGIGLDILWPQFAALLAIGVTLMFIAVVRLKKKLD